MFTNFKPFIIFRPRYSLQRKARCN